MFSVCDAVGWLELCYLWVSSSVLALILLWEERRIPNMKEISKKECWSSWVNEEVHVLPRLNAVGSWGKNFWALLWIFESKRTEIPVYIDPQTLGDVILAMLALHWLLTIKPNASHSPFLLLIVAIKYLLDFVYSLLPCHFKWCLLVFELQEMV